jgi:hypothetical protein
MDFRSITIISGGQTGVDRTALDFAIEHGLEHGGWCPRGRLAEDGAISATYQLAETTSRRYAQRTEWNVRDSDGTVVFSIGQPAGGTALTLEIARRLRKPYIQLSRDGLGNSIHMASAIIVESAKRLLDFLDTYVIRRLNIAGPRSSQEPEAAEFAAQVLRAAMDFSDSR